ncbi:pentatricopeptide repeat-containing protein At4g02750-like [Selaginella moellendorffii]|uniref:pentatricopeptide repeat-containing protein At4g02750-like n=1 Tax=Selaginella moellendorffii TaxID=88036 RepID=UPI000D1C21F1|nr:pentatricopeptide repeat-containing protein At4g02750-like [Selaginella moellendorffii]|eukprot:XP_024544259.1 pentatricopeptide repeat-containing protein At4g02750-like [Selaginella moellendorffii]
MHGQDLITWNLMITAFARSLDLARKFFDRMPKRNEVAWNCLISTFAKWTFVWRFPRPCLTLCRNRILFRGQGYSMRMPSRAYTWRPVFKRMPLHDAMLSTAMITAFVQNGMDVVISVEENSSINLVNIMFEKMPFCNVVSWNAVVAANAQLGYVEEMNARIRQNATEARCVMELSDQGALSLRQSRDVTAWNIMTSAYEQNGFFQEALTTFHKMLVRDLVSWNAISRLMRQQLDSAEEVTDKMPFGAHGER